MSSRPVTGGSEAPSSRGTLRHLQRAGWRLVGRPAEMVPGVRWAFLVCVLLSLLLTLPAAVATSSPLRLLLGTAAALLLASSWLYSYLRNSAPLVLDISDSVALACLGAASAQPEAVLAVVFAALWFRSMYGSTARAMVRCAMYATGINVALLLWSQVQGPGLRDGPSLAPVIPVMFVTVAIGRTLAVHLLSREHSDRRDAVLLRFGSGLLGMTDDEQIFRHLWRTLTDVCALTPSLRMLMAVQDGAALRVVGSAGDFAEVPVTLPASLVTAAAAVPAGPGTYAPVDPAALDRAVGDPRRWFYIPIPHRGQPRWLFLGAPGPVPTDVLTALQSTTNQTVLALRTTEVHEELTAQARTDSLTGLANRSAFTVALADALLGAGAADTAVLFLDLDDFKDVNDGLGHAAGDALLAEVADRLRGSVRPADICARLGGDEFAVLLPATPGSTAQAIAERLVETVAAPFRLGDHVATIGASVGVAHSATSTDLAQLLHRADVAMYAAKAHGKNRVQVFRDGLLQRGSPVALAAGPAVVAAPPGQLAAAAGQPLLP